MESSHFPPLMKADQAYQCPWSAGGVRLGRIKLSGDTFALELGPEKAWVRFPCLVPQPGRQVLWGLVSSISGSAHPLTGRCQDWWVLRCWNLGLWEPRLFPPGNGCGHFALEAGGGCNDSSMSILPTEDPEKVPLSHPSLRVLLSLMSSGAAL